MDDVGNVGIGTASSGEKLEIDGNIRATGAITSGSSIIIDGTGANGIMNNSSGDLILQTGGVSRVYIDSSFGSVGIGTTTPHNAMLDVVSGVTARAFGAINIASDLSLRIGVDGEAVAIHGVGVHGAATSTSGTNKGVWGRTESPDGFAAYFTGVSGSKNYFQRNVGIGTDSPIYPLHVEANANKAVFGKTTATTGTAYGGYFHSDAPTGVGVFGYGWNATGKNYGVRGQSRSTNGTGVYGWALATSGTNYGIYGETRSSTGYAGYFKGGRNYFEGNVGIGTTNPGAKLQLGGTNANLLMYESGGSPFVAVGDSNTTVGWLQWNSGGNELDVYTFGHDFPIAIGPTSVGGVFVDTDSNGGNVGIGTESPSFKLHVNGSAGKPGGGSWTNSSDRRLKKNIRDLTGSLDRLMKLRSVTFEYKDPDAINELHGERIGMIAQEVEEVFPDWVSVGGHGYKTLTFRGFEALTVEALRELRAEKDAQIDVLRRENVAMQERVARLEHLLLAKEEATR